MNGNSVMTVKSIHDIWTFKKARDCIENGGISARRNMIFRKDITGNAGIKDVTDVTPDGGIVRITMVSGQTFVCTREEMDSMNLADEYVDDSANRKCLDRFKNRYVYTKKRKVKYEIPEDMHKYWKECKRKFEGRYDESYINFLDWMRIWNGTEVNTTLGLRPAWQYIDRLCVKRLDKCKNMCYNNTMLSTNGRYGKFVVQKRDNEYLQLHSNSNRNTHAIAV